MTFKDDFRPDLILMAECRTVPRGRDVVGPRAVPREKRSGLRGA
jgi:hypothetical protein